ncbi:MAG: hypothetical protein U0165_09800 [Polyangiaceae bacterium]
MTLSLHDPYSAPPSSRRRSGAPEWHIAVIGGLFFLATILVEGWRLLGR